MTAGGPPVEPRWALTDHHGRQVTERNFRGRYQLVFFGFTHCRMVCPRALSKLSAVLDDIGELAERIQPLYISVDPKRDTPDAMRVFLEQNYPKFLGLTGDAAESEVARNAFRVFARRREDPDDPDGYAVPHSALIYLIDPGGRYVTHFPDVAGADRIADSLKKLVH